MRIHLMELLNFNSLTVLWQSPPISIMNLLNILFPYCFLLTCILYDAVTVKSILKYILLYRKKCKLYGQTARKTKKLGM